MGQLLTVDFVERMKEYVGYCRSVVSVLKQREQRQMDYEALQENLEVKAKDLQAAMDDSNTAGKMWSQISRESPEQRQERIKKMTAAVEEARADVADCQQDLEKAKT